MSKTASAAWSIAAVARDTGLGKDTLRAWERRYGFPVPERDARGERLYSNGHVEKLRLIKRLLDRGYRPGAIVQSTLEELQQLMRSGASGETALPPSIEEGLRDYLELCRLHRAEELRRSLAQSMMRLGLQRFIIEVIAPLNVIVGEYWEQGHFQVYEEHLYTEAAQTVLRSGIASISSHDHAQSRPRILLTTIPQESHTLGLLMAEAMFTMAGARCISLGGQTPIPDIAQAAQDFDVVALSFSIALSSNEVLNSLGDLAATLPSTKEIWAGGRASALASCALPLFYRVELESIASRIVEWRREHA